MSNLDRKTGIDCIGNLPWGSHIGLFYQTKEDLKDILLPFIEVGLRNNEYCLVSAAGPLPHDEILEALGRRMDNFDEYLSKGQIEVVPYTECHAKDGGFSKHKVLALWDEKIDHALDMGYDGLRVLGNVTWLDKSSWNDFMDYEGDLNRVIENMKMVVICAYWTDMSNFNELLDVMNAHQFALIKRQDRWRLIENVELKETRRALREAKAQAELYLDLMGHDINNMNQSAMGFLELALETLEKDKKLKLDDKILIEKPLKALTSSSALIDNVRKLQKLMKEGVKTRPIDLNVLLKEIERHSFHSNSRSVTINIQPVPQYMVEANELLRDVFFNLISNAVKHSDEEKPITVNVKVEPARGNRNRRTYHRCIVEDDGPGIPDDLKEKLFHRFQRGATKAHGKGLGLYIVRTLIEGYHGKVWVEDRVKGDHTKGAKFVVELPAVET